MFCRFVYLLSGSFSDNGTLKDFEGGGLGLVFIRTYVQQVCIYIADSSSPS